MNMYVHLLLIVLEGQLATDVGGGIVYVRAPAYNQHRGCLRCARD